MPIVTSRETVDQVYGSLLETSPSPDEQAAGRLAAIGEALDNLSSTVGAVSAYRLYLDDQDPRRLSREAAQKFAADNGVQELRGIGDDGISPSALKLLVARQQRKQERARRIENAELGGLETLALGLVGSAPDPINLVGLGWAGRSKTLLGAAAKGAAIGTATTAAAEPLFYGLSRFAGDDYTLQDSMLNVATGGALGTGFHGAGHVIGGIRERRANVAKIAQDLADDLPPSPADFTALEDLPTSRSLTVQEGEGISGDIGLDPRLEVTSEQRAIIEKRREARSYLAAIQEYVAKGGDMPEVPFTELRKAGVITADQSRLNAIAPDTASVARATELRADVAQRQSFEAARGAEERPFERAAQDQAAQKRRAKRVQERTKKSAASKKAPPKTEPVPGPVGRDPLARAEFDKTRAAPDPTPPVLGEEATELRKQFTAEERARKASRGTEISDAQFEEALARAEAAEEPPIDFDTLVSAVRCAIKKGAPRGV
jgi:hypothetical protein